MVFERFGNKNDGSREAQVKAQPGPLRREERAASRSTTDGQEPQAQRRGEAQNGARSRRGGHNAPSRS